MAAKHALGDVCEVVKRSDVFHIDPKHIEVVDGWNARTDFSGEDDLIASIKERGVVEPLIVIKTSDKRLELVDGERRLRAALKAREEGAEILSVPVMVAKKGTSQADLFFDSLTVNTGKPFTPTEEARAFKRLTNWGFDSKTIAARYGCSVSHVRNRLELSEASPEVQTAVNTGEITIGQAQEIAKEADGKIDRQSQELSKAKATPKERKLVLSFKKGKIRQTGYKDASCDPLKDIFQSPDLIESIEAAGFDPQSIRVTINHVSSESSPEKQVPLFTEKE